MAYSLPILKLLKAKDFIISNFFKGLDMTRIQNCCIKKTIWLILTFLMTFLISCTHIKSVRTYKGNKVEIIKKQKINNLSNDVIFEQPPASRNSKSSSDSWEDYDDNNSKFDKLVLDSLKNEFDELKAEFQTLTETVFQLRKELFNLSSNEITGLVTNNESSNLSLFNNSKVNEAKHSSIISQQKKLKPNLKEKAKVDSKVKLQEKHEPFKISSECEFANNLDIILSDIKNKQFTEGLNKLFDLRAQTKDKHQISIIDYWIGEIYYLTKNYTKALEYFQKAVLIQNTPKTDKANIMIAECLSRLGKTKEAKEAYKNFLEKYPYSEFVPRAKKMLQQL